MKGETSLGTTRFFDFSWLVDRGELVVGEDAVSRGDHGRQSDGEGRGGRRR